MRKERGKKKRGRRGPGPVAAVLLTAAVCCWTGLVQVDRQIRAVTINQSPPLWERREEGDIDRVTVLGHGAAVDLGPARQAGKAIQTEAREVLETPGAPARMAMAFVENVYFRLNFGKRYDIITK